MKLASKLTNNFWFKYFWNILIAIDQFVNVLAFGDPDETISSRCGKWLYLPHSTVKWKIAYVLCRLLHILDKGHCDKSIESDEGSEDLL